MNASSSPSAGRVRGARLLLLKTCHKQRPNNAAGCGWGSHSGHSEVKRTNWPGSAPTKLKTTVTTEKRLKGVPQGRGAEPVETAPRTGREGRRWSHGSGSDVFGAEVGGNCDGLQGAGGESGGLLVSP